MSDLAQQYLAQGSFGKLVRVSDASGRAGQIEHPGEWAMNLACKLQA